VGLGPLIQVSASQGAGTFVYLETGGTQAARHADCRLRGKRLPGFTTAGCSVSSATGSVPLVGLVTLRYRLRGATGRLGYRPACRVPALRWSFPPPIAEGSGKGLVLPTQPG